MDEKKKHRQASCPHPGFSQEHILGSGTGDYLCDRCGIDRDSVKEPWRCKHCGEPITDWGNALQVTVSGEPARYEHLRCVRITSDPPPLS